MRLNHDCIRDVMLCIEANTPEAHSLINTDGVCELLCPLYSPNEILYHVRLMNEAGFLNNVQFTLGGGAFLQGLTWDGHQYLDTVRDTTVWSKLKDGTVDISCMSLDLLGQLAKELGLSYAKKKLGLE